MYKVTQKMAQNLFCYVDFIIIHFCSIKSLKNNDDDVKLVYVIFERKVLWLCYIQTHFLGTFFHHNNIIIIKTKHNQTSFVLNKLYKVKRFKFFLSHFFLFSLILLKVFSMWKVQLFIYSFLLLLLLLLLCLTSHESILHAYTIKKS